MPRVPQQQLGANPVSIPGLPDANLPRTNMAGTLAGIIGGGLDVATRAIEFQAAAQQLTNANTINDIRHAEEQARRQAYAAKQLQDAENSRKEEDRGFGRLKFAEDQHETLALIASGKVFVGDSVDDAGTNEAFRSYIDASTAGMSPDAAAGFEDAAQRVLLPAIFSKQADNYEQMVGQELDSLTTEVTASIKTPEQAKELIRAKSNQYGLSESDITNRVFIPALKTMADRGDKEAITIANGIDLRADVRQSIVDHTTSVQERAKRDAETAQTEAFTATKNKIAVWFSREIDQLHKFDAGTQLDLIKARDTGLVTPNQFDELNGKIERWRKDSVEQSEALWKRASSQQTHADAVNSQVSLVASGEWYNAEDIETPTGVGEEKIKTTVEQMRRNSFDAAAANIDAIPGLSPEENQRLKVQAAFNQNYVPVEYKSMVQSGLQQMQALGQAVGGKVPVVMNDAMRRTLTIYRDSRRISPAYAEQLFTRSEDRAYLDSISDYLASNSDDIGGAVQNANAATLGGSVSVELARGAAKKLASSDADYAATGTLMTNAILAEARRGVARNLSPEKAIANATELFASKSMKINGYTTVVANREWVPKDEGVFDDHVRLWFQNIAANFADQNVFKGVAITPNDMLLDQDADTGYWRVRDARNGDLVSTGGGLALSVFSTRELVGVAARAKMKDTIKKANERVTPGFIPEMSEAGVAF